MRGSAAASELEPQTPRSRRRVLCGDELPFSRGFGCQAGEIPARSALFQGSADDVAGAIDRDANRDLDIAAYRLTRRARYVGNFLMEHGGRRGHRRLRILHRRLRILRSCRRGGPLRKIPIRVSRGRRGRLRIGMALQRAQAGPNGGRYHDPRDAGGEPTRPRQLPRSGSPYFAQERTRGRGRGRLLRGLDLGFEFTDGGTAGAIATQTSPYD